MIPSVSPNTPAEQGRNKSGKHWLLWLGFGLALTLQTVDCVPLFLSQLIGFCMFVAWASFNVDWYVVVTSFLSNVADIMFREVRSCRGQQCSPAARPGAKPPRRNPFFCDFTERVRPWR